MDFSERPTDPPTGGGVGPWTFQSMSVCLSVSVCLSRRAFTKPELGTGWKLDMPRWFALREPSPPIEQTGVEREECLSRRLYSAVARCKTATFVELLAEGANPNWAHPDDGRTPLHVAAQNGRPDFILGLLRAGTNVDNTDDRGRTALDLFLKGKTCIVGCLFMRKASSYDCLALLIQAHQVHSGAIDI